MSERTPQRKPRRALNQVGGEVELWIQDESLGRILAHALDVTADERETMCHVHGFHSYPARMHPVTAARLVAGLTQPNATVVDPFCGSGTVLVEARLAGRRAVGVDANPLAVALSRLKLGGIAVDQSELLLAVVEAVAEHAEARRAAKAGPSRRYSMAQRALFDPHVLLELDGLSQGIEQHCPKQFVPTLELVLSSLLTKFSRRRSDTSSAEVPRRIASGFVIRFFVKKSRELLGRLQDYARRVPAGAPPATVQLGDARHLPHKDATASCVITSPPYPGIYDYVEHHRLRLQWLKMDLQHLERHEIGAHRNYAERREQQAETAWATELGACLTEMARVLVPGGTAALLIADSVVAGRAWFADKALRQIAATHGMTVIGGASQRRGFFFAATPNAFKGAERREHLILLRRAAANPSRNSTSDSRSERRASGGAYGGHRRRPALRTSREQQPAGPHAQLPERRIEPLPSRSRSRSGRMGRVQRRGPREG